MITDLEPSYIDGLFRHLENRGFDVAEGLSPDEFRSIETRYGLRFPPDLKTILERGLPLGPRFPDWRSPPSDQLLAQLTWPASGICFDVERNDFWWPDWGTRPKRIDLALDTTRYYVYKAPALIPLYGHRYLPAEPYEASNPVFSVYQTDIIYYGFDLPSWFEAEFDYPNRYENRKHPQPIRFWKDLEAANG